MSIRVATAVADAVTESAVVQAVTQTESAQLVRRCRELVELRAVAATTEVDLAVIDGRLRGLDRDIVDELRHRGVRCVVLSDVGADDVLAIGVAAVVGRDLVGLAEALTSVPSTAPSTTPESLAAVSARAAGPGSGRLVVVWGPPGAPGRSTVAIELAGALCRLARARSRQPIQDCLLIDADTVAPSLAQQLGLIDDTSGLAAAARLAGRGRLDREQLAALAVAIPAGPRVLTGLPTPDRWSELRPAAMQAVLTSACSAVSWTVVDAGFGIEGDDADWADPSVPQRFGAARAALAAADVVLCVGQTDPVSMTRLLRHLPQVRDLAPTADVRVVLNRGASRSAVALVEASAGAPWAVLPDDPRSISATLARGGSVGELVPDSPFAAQVAAMAAELAGPYDRAGERTARSHRRLLRRAHRRHRRRDARVV